MFCVYAIWAFQYSLCDGLQISLKKLWFCLGMVADLLVYEP